jgi:hypothetical protein
MRCSPSSLYDPRRHPRNEGDLERSQWAKDTRVDIWKDILPVDI